VGGCDLKKLNKMQNFWGNFLKLNTLDTTLKFLDHEVDALQGRG
jgi:hypothetical protein